jgi:hypothetical protein
MVPETGSEVDQCLDRGCHRNSATSSRLESGEDGSPMNHDARSPARHALGNAHVNLSLFYRADPPEYSCSCVTENSLRPTTENGSHPMAILRELGSA